jgi:hypothetical protein
MLPPFIIDQIRRREEEERLRDEQQPRLELPIDAFPPKPRPRKEGELDEDDAPDAPDRGVIILDLG